MSTDESKTHKTDHIFKGMTPEDNLIGIVKKHVHNDGIKKTTPPIEEQKLFKMPTTKLKKA